ncbi:nitroreductase family protein [Actinomycetota bacterium]
MKAILERRSIRKYTDGPVSETDMEDLLKAAMAAPSAGNEQPWEFLVVTDRENLEAITTVHPYSSMLLGAPAAIIVCGDENKEQWKGYWPQDCSAATENILIAAQDKGLGSVWLGVYPMTDRVEGIKKIFNLPDNIIPFCVLPIGHPAEEKGPSNRYDSSRVHREKW